jgi:hypothetical protein
MTHPSTPRRRWRRTALATAGVSLIAAVAPMISASPAGAVTAPLATTDGVGIRLDENAIVGPALELIEDELQPFVNTKIQQGAAANSVMDDPDWVTGTATVELSFDFITPNTTTYPQGGLSVHAALSNILMRFYRYGEWWQPSCLIHVVPDPGYIDASAKVNTALLPAAPLQLNPITAYWDETPTATIAPGYSWACNGYLIDEWWDGLWGNSSNVADQLENELNAQAQDLVNDLWADHVVPVINSLTAYGITVNQVRTDTYGLIVTANTDASAGLTIPGDPAPPRTVANAQDSGATSNVNTLLATRATDVIVTIHPNVANQFLMALRSMLAGQFGGPTVSSSIETVLLDPSVRGNYADGGWTVSLSTPLTTNAPYLFTTGGGAAPKVKIDNIRLTVRNTTTGTAAVATFEGPAANILLDTEIRTGGVWGPAYDPTSMTATLTRTQGNADVIAFNGAASGMLPYAKEGVVYFNEAIFQQYAALAPVTISTLSVTLCTTCAQYSGDERYTETFLVG